MWKVCKLCWKLRKLVNIRKIELLSSIQLRFHIMINLALYYLISTWDQHIFTLPGELNSTFMKLTKYFLVRIHNSKITKLIQSKFVFRTSDVIYNCLFEIKGWWSRIAFNSFHSNQFKKFKTSDYRGREVDL